MESAKGLEILNSTNPELYHEILSTQREITKQLNVPPFA
jgi:hypothetical protein